MSSTLSFFTPVVLSCLLAYVLGYGSVEDAGDVARSVFFTLATCVFYIYSSRRKWACNIAFALGLLFALAYIPLGVGVDYGRPNMSLIASLLESNADESLEFITNLNWRDCALAILGVFLLCTYRFRYGPSRGAAQVQPFHKPLWTFLLIANVFGLFVYHCVVAYKQYGKEKNIVSESLKAVDWDLQIVQRNPSLKVLVIGESVNKRYLSVMGSPWKTTPFLDSSPQVTAYTQYYSPAPNTVTSLSRTLTYSNSLDGGFDLRRNVVALAKAAGYGTLWVSNQRSMGPNDSNVAQMGHQADHHRFLDKVPVIEPAKDDFALLNYLQGKLAQPGALSRDSVVFLHMIGSHPHACSRVPDMSLNLRAGHGRHIDCYLASLQKLDLFMQKLTALLAQQTKDYEVLYVSDHSLRVSPMSETERLMDGLRLPTKNIYVQPQVKEAYDTPLIFISSHQKQARRNTTPLSGFDFFHLFGNWLGVQSRWIKPEKNLRNPGSSAPVQVYNWSRMVALDSLADTEPLRPVGVATP
ncbi:hypothetical protein DZC30_17310 [Comamonas testosteroni]|uniref:Sulfatase N-terminal domain-containing protein n=1 Tax=Comamonas testosteroni TaxID=285 RepID=A0A373FDH9_COMTE|nr:phosphoethanolamine transferase [Comamonas testosteroni]RGE42057.1 hypothetical protein DZC30_17310 [Comamonas testosteroni]